MPSAEDLKRDADSQTAETQAEAENTANKAATAAQIIILEQIIRALPAPLNAAASALGEGTFAALNISLVGVRNPSPSGNDNPIKLIALGIAFAIIRAIWCFIKSLLNPLPIVGSFFPLCSNDPQLAEGTDAATNQARADASSDLSNQALNAQILAFNTEARKRPKPKINAAQETESATRENETGAGISFNDFVAKTAPTPAVTDTNEAGPDEALRGQTNQASTSANIPAQPAREPDWQPGDRPSSNEPLTYQEARKLFGL